MGTKINFQQSKTHLISFHPLIETFISQGPKRLCRFCLFGLLLPITLLCVPLYMRFISLRPHRFTLSPMDMKLLNYEHTVSTIWCSQQTIRMNSTFNAYLLPEKPKLLRKKHRVKMERKIVDLEDDMKEFWGFYLLDNSFFRLEACSRHEGASVVVIKHTKNVAKCAWLGELDSAEESDEISSEFDFQQEVLGDETAFTEDDIIEKSDEASDTDETKVLISENSMELSKYLENMEKWSSKSRKLIVKKLLEQILSNKNPDEPTDMEMFQKVLGDNSYVEEPHVEPVKKGSNQDFIYEEYENLEEYGYQQEKDVDHFMDNGKFNQKNLVKEDKSNEEARSSWSSSEEALASCEGAVFNIALNGATACNENATFVEMKPLMTNMTHMTDSAGFYYFIFTNENEITSNFVAANFEMRKTVFDLRTAENSCENMTDCSLLLSFFSQQNVVIEVFANNIRELDIKIIWNRYLTSH